MQMTCIEMFFTLDSRRSFNVVVVMLTPDSTKTSSMPEDTPWVRSSRAKAQTSPSVP